MGLFGKKDLSMSQTAWQQYVQDVMSRNKFLQDSSDMIHQNDPYYAEMEGDVNRMGGMVDESNAMLYGGLPYLDRANDQLLRTEGDFGSATDELGRAESGLEGVEPYLRQFYTGNMDETPFVKALISKGQEGINKSYDDAMAATRARAATSGLSMDQPITNFAESQQDIARAHELGVLPRDALLASVDPAMRAIEEERGIAGTRTGIAGGYGDIASRRANVAQGFGSLADRRGNIASGYREGASVLGAGAGIRGQIGEERLQGAGLLNTNARSYNPEDWYQIAAGQQKATNDRKSGLIGTAAGIAGSFLSPVVGGLTKKLFDRFKGTPGSTGSWSGVD